jgi:transcriptional regulator with XRE-family HTH domain
MARAALQIGIRDLAELAKVSASTIARFEAGEELKERTIAALRAAFESAGVEFIAENGGGPGVRLKKRGAKGDQNASIPVEKLNASNDD